MKKRLIHAKACWTQESQSGLYYRPDCKSVVLWPRKTHCADQFAHCANISLLQRECIRAGWVSDRQTHERNCRVEWWLVTARLVFIYFHFASRLRWLWLLNEPYCEIRFSVLQNITLRSPFLFCLLTVRVEVIYFRLVTLRHTPQSIGLLWTSDRPVAEISTLQHKHCTRDKHPCLQWDSNPRSQQALGRRPTP
jgi:hypothetical protein